MVDISVILRPEPSKVFERNSKEVCTSVVIKGGLLIMYMYGVSCSDYIFIWITFMGRDGDKR